MHEAESQLATTQDFEAWKSEVGEPAFDQAHKKLIEEMTRTEKAKGFEPSAFDMINMLDEAAHALADFVSGKKSLNGTSKNPLPKVIKQTKIESNK